MSQTKTTTILFTGYAPIHFVCFRPLYERLVNRPDFSVFVSGGLRTQIEPKTESKSEPEFSYDVHAMYEPFGIPEDKILSVEEIRMRDFDVLFGANTKLISPKNVGTRVQIFHGISFRNKAIRPDNMGCDFYFIVGPYMRRKFVQAGLLTENDPRGLQVGFPKTDRLLNGELSRDKLLLRYGFDGTRPILLYAPTGQKYNSLETMGEQVIKLLAESNQYDLLIKLHDHPKDNSIDWFSRLAVLENAHTRIVRDFDVIPLLFLADLLITDASSVSSEYSLLDRPMVFLDVPKLIKRATTYENTAVDLHTWGRRGGIVVQRPVDIIEAISGSLNEKAYRSDIRRAMAKDLFYNPGSATDEAISWLFQYFTN